MSGTTPPPTAPAAPITVPASPIDKETRPLPTAPQPSSPPPPPPPTNETEYQKRRERFHSKKSSEYFDPCQEAAARSLRCLTRNQSDKDMCSDYFQAYRDCKKRWTEERKEEKRKLTAWW